MKEKVFFFCKNVSRPSNPPDELAQNVSKKIPSGRIIPPFFLRKCRIWPFLNYLHDSNSIFPGPGELIQNGFSGRTVRAGSLGSGVSEDRGRSSINLLMTSRRWQRELQAVSGSGADDSVNSASSVIARNLSTELKDLAAVA